MPARSASPTEHGLVASLALLAITTSLATGCGFVGSAQSGPTRSSAGGASGAEVYSPSQSTAASNRAAGPSARKPLAGVVVTVDPGHNGNDGDHPELVNRLVDIGTKMKACESTGTATSSGLTEAGYNWDVAQLLKDDLSALGARVVMTRAGNDGVGPCIDERARIGNRARSDVAISIHADGGPQSGRGFHVIVPRRIAGLTDDIASPSMEFGMVLRAVYRRGTGIPYATYLGGGNGYTVRDDLGGLNLSDVPKVFIETGNMNSPVDARLLESPSFRERIATAMADAVKSWMGRRRGSR